MLNMKRVFRNQYKYLYVNEDVYKGIVCIKDINIPLYIILEDISKGYSIDEILTSYPTLQRKLFQNVLEDIAQDYSSKIFSL